jgi:hypothetical protein
VAEGFTCFSPLKQNPHFFDGSVRHYVSSVECRTAEQIDEVHEDEQTVESEEVDVEWCYVVFLNRATQIFCRKSIYTRVMTDAAAD